MGLIDICKRGYGKVSFFCKEYSPQIHFVLGVIAFAETCRSFYNAKPKYEQVMKEYHEELAKQKEAEEKADNVPGGGQIRYPEEDRKADRRTIKLKTGVKVVKVFAGPTVKAAVTLTLFRRGFGILEARNKGLTEVASALAMAPEKKVELTDGESTEVAKTDEPEYEICTDPVVKEFDRKNPNFSDMMENNRFFLQQKQNYCNLLLHSRGYLFLNEVFELLDMEKTEAGQVIGWKYYNETTDALKNGASNFVSFGIFDTDDPVAGPVFAGARLERVMLRFNVDKKPLFGRTGLKKR